MSHYHLEIVMPPTDDVEGAVGRILEPFCESNEDATYPFWDWYVIGGRWSGHKAEAMLSKERKDAFSALLKEKKVTVSPLICGKLTLAPASQILMVDALWREHFPDSPHKQCPWFDHYDGDDGNVMRLDQMHESVQAAHVIIADDEGGVTYRSESSIWNGSNFQDTDWSGKVIDAVNKAKERYPKLAPQPDWLVVTVDYHS
jgi:hypothetical protein